MEQGQESESKVKGQNLGFRSRVLGLGVWALGLRFGVWSLRVQAYGVRDTLHHFN